MVNTRETRGLGAGSYPEAPELPEEGARCERCGWHRGLKEVDGQLLCLECRTEYYREACRGRYWSFINRSREEQRRFALEFWFQNLPPEEQGRIAMEAFCHEYETPFPQKQNEKSGIVSEYIHSSKSEFADYIESRDGAA